MVNETKVVWNVAGGVRKDCGEGKERGGRCFLSRDTNQVVDEGGRRSRQVYMGKRCKY